MTTPAEIAGRFTGRAENYARFRQGYPDAVIDLLRAEVGWRENASVADIGAGTGVSSELFLRHGNNVWAVEPNADMRAATVGLRARYPNFEVVEGAAEATTLRDFCADFIVAATAFHWFDAGRCRTEFLRILKPKGQVVLLWNQRQSETSPFLKEYEQLLLRFGTDYKQRWGNERKDIPGRVSGFFGGSFGEASFHNPQNLDMEGLTGRLLSTSYAPLPGHPDYEPMVQAVGGLFHRFSRDGVVTMEYQTVVYWGRPPAGALEA